MSNPPATPRRHATYETGTPTTTPQAARTMAAGSHIIHSSPHYTTTRRHSLYGTEDRIILDPGSRIWKVGFSGEGKPRDVSYADGETGNPLWTLNRAANLADREEEDRLLEAKVQTCLRAVFHEYAQIMLIRTKISNLTLTSSLLTDPKSRKIIIIEHPLLPLHIKDMFARILFNNLQVLFISINSVSIVGLSIVGPFDIICFQPSAVSSGCWESDWSCTRLRSP